LIKEFLEKLGDDIHDMLREIELTGENYHGLDRERDTEDEVETAIRFFPEVLSRRKGIVVDVVEDVVEEVVEDDDDDDDDTYNVDILWFFYPIQSIVSKRLESFETSNVKAVFFVPILARLAIEFGCFDEVLKGELLCKDYHGRDVLENLMFIDNRSENREYHEFIDDKYLQVLIQLRKKDLLKKEDFQSYNLLIWFCINDLYYAGKRFRFLVEWDPDTLIHPDTMYGNLPLHFISTQSSSIRGFKLIFEYGIRYYPKKNGINLLFRKNNDGNTPFQVA
jgi:hypothetical protein